MKPEREARVALCKCKEGKKVYGVRFEKSQMDGSILGRLKLKKCQQKEKAIRVLRLLEIFNRHQIIRDVHIAEHIHL